MVTRLRAPSPHNSHPSPSLDFCFQHGMRWYLFLSSMDYLATLYSFNYPLCPPARQHQFLRHSTCTELDIGHCCTRSIVVVFISLRAHDSLRSLNGMENENECIPHDSLTGSHFILVCWFLPRCLMSLNRMRGSGHALLLSFSTIFTICSPILHP
jgi:hypothetical protein